MSTTNYSCPAPTMTRGSSCHSANQASGGWLSRRRGLLLGGGVIAAGVAVALSRHWLAPADLFPLLFLAPCAVMTLMCMKKHGQNAGGNQAAPNADNSTGTGTAAG